MPGVVFRSPRSHDRCTAAVVGLVLNLAVWFGIQTLSSPKDTVNWFGVAVGLASFIALQWTRLGIISVIFLSGGLGLARYVVF
ncbi:MAG: hypothetical protein H6Q51_1486 [Deltaproteobacteria bacterium]|nr:hypothetical protein [Deltaproteobacteria bacterium]